MDYPGTIAAPQITVGVNSTDQELLFAYSPPPFQKGVTLKPGQGVLPLGTLLAFDAATKKYIKTATPANAKGFLRQTVDTGADANASGVLGNILYGGVLNLSLVSAANSGVTLTSVLDGQVDTV